MRRRHCIQRGIAGSVALGAGLARAALAGGQPVERSSAACRRLDRVRLGGHTLYTTAEPCPMCMGAVPWAGLDRVVFGASIADISPHMAQIHIAAREVAVHADHQCEVTGPVERALCNGLFNDPVLAPVYQLWRKRT